MKFTFSVYFLIMGTGLIFVPQFLVNGVTGSANIIAIMLDVSSVWMGEYKLSHAMIDLPVEALSLTGILLIRKKNKTLL